MITQVILRLETSPEQGASLRRLQAAFAEVCTALGLVVRDTRCWNRVTLHHLMYRNLREQFPEMGSQMVCNAIYSVSRSARLLFQSPSSPWNIERREGGRLPTLKFAASAPVYFDRHTLSLRKGALSMYTLDGRLRFHVGLSPENESLFREGRLKEVVLLRDGTTFSLFFTFGSVEEQLDSGSELPDYVFVIDSEAEVQAA